MRVLSLNLNNLLKRKKSDCMNESSKTYRIDAKSVWLEPYWQALKDGSHPEVEYTDKQTYKKLSKETTVLVLREFFDVPDKKMTIEDVKKEFASSTAGMSDETAKKIARYYNGRKDIFDKIVSLLDDESFEQFREEIPAELNGFTTQDKDEEYQKTQCLESWIEVRAE